MGYKQYFKYIGKYDHTKDYERLNMDLHLVIDVGGYFWTRGKSISKSGDYLKSNTPLDGKYQYYKKIRMPDYTTIDINIVANKDHVAQVSYLVNGGYNGLLSERIKYTKN